MLVLPPLLPPPLLHGPTHTTSTQTHPTPHSDALPAATGGGGALKGYTEVGGTSTLRLHPSPRPRPRLRPAHGFLMLEGRGAAGRCGDDAPVGMTVGSPARLTLEACMAPAY